jgi:hypothetical protein
MMLHALVLRRRKVPVASHPTLPWTHRSCTIRQRACNYEDSDKDINQLVLLVLLFHRPYSQLIVIGRYRYCILVAHLDRRSLANLTTMAALNIHGDPMPSYAVGSIPSAFSSSQTPTAAIVIHQQESDLATPARSTCSRPTLSPGGMLIVSSRRRRRRAIWPIFRGHSVWKMLVSQTHIGNLSSCWNAALKQNRMRRSLYLGCPEYAFENVDPRAMALILYIAHFNTHWLPRELSLMEIIQLAKLADRYDLNHILVGYLGRWIAPHRHRILERGYEQWLFVAWQFGLEDDYLRLANYMAVNCAVNEEGELRYPLSNRNRPVRGLFPTNAISKLSLPSHLISSRQTRLLEVFLHASYQLPQSQLNISQLTPFIALICSTRTLTLNSIIGVTQDLINELVLNSDNTPCANRTAHPTERATCTARSAINLQRYLTEHNLPSEVLAAERHLHPVQYYLRVLMHPNIDEWIRDRRGTIPGHSECRVGDVLRGRVLQTMMNARWAASAELLTQLRANGGELFLNIVRLFDLLIMVGHSEAREAM